MTICIGPILNFTKEGEAFYSIEVSTGDRKKVLWYSVDEQFESFLSDTHDAALVALLIPAMANGEDIHVDGSVSEKIYYSLTGPYQTLIKDVIPSLKSIKISAARVVPNKERAEGVATGFSAGIDSYCTLADHYYANVPKGFKVTHLLFNNVGSHGTGGKKLFLQRYNRVIKVVEDLKIPLIKVDSNLDEFYHEPYGFEQTHTPRNASVGLLLQKGIGRFMYSSAYAYRDLHNGAANTTAYTDAIALPMLSTAALDSISVGSEYSRVQKTVRVSGVESSWGSLDVCVDPNSNGNCSVCWKCMRTCLTLEIAGTLDRYAPVMDIEKYKSRRARFMIELLRSDNPLLTEIVEFAKEKNFAFSLKIRLAAALYYPASLAWRILKLPLKAYQAIAKSIPKISAPRADN